MPIKSWHLNRRTLLQGAGAALALPLLDGMTNAADAQKELPRRLCCVYFPFGVAVPKDDSPEREWGWFPLGEGRDYQFTNPLKPLQALRDQMTILGGLSHPKCRKMGGHDTGDTFLTAAELSGSQLANTVSIDQLAAQQLDGQTRFPSLTLSSDGGVGEPTRSTTLSFSREGRPIPALSNPQQIFDRLFGQGDQQTTAEIRKLKTAASMLDLVREDSHRLKLLLGKHDQQKLEDYLASVRSVEERVRNAQKWINIPKPEVDAGQVDLEVDQKAPREYLRTMYDLMFLAFQTDSTRLATYMIGQVAGATTIANAFPASIGLQGNWHGLAHSAGKPEGAKNLGRFDQFLTEQLAYFIDRLATAPEGDGSLLDRTILLYGSSNSRTHQNVNYPLIVAGGRRLGMRHGQYLKFTSDTPLSNLFVTMLDKIQVPVESFQDSTGELSEITL